MKPRTPTARPDVATRTKDPSIPPNPPPQLWGLWCVCRQPGSPTEGYWRSHIHRPTNPRDDAPMTFVSREDAAEYATQVQLDSEDDTITVALIGIDPNAV